MAVLLAVGQDLKVGFNRHAELLQSISDDERRQIPAMNWDDDWTKQSDPMVNSVTALLTDISAPNGLEKSLELGGRYRCDLRHGMGLCQSE